MLWQNRCSQNRFRLHLHPKNQVPHHAARNPEEFLKDEKSPLAYDKVFRIKTGDPFAE